MDAKTIDKIADKLIQFHAKLPERHTLDTSSAKIHVSLLSGKIHMLLKELDRYADAEDKGWIR